MKLVIFVLCLISVVKSDEGPKPPALLAPPPKITMMHLNSYLPAVMQVVAHLTNQMKYERDTSGMVTTSSSTTTESSTSSSTTQSSTTTSTTTESTTRSTTQAPSEDTTPFHAPANFAPLIPGPPRSSIRDGVLSDPEPEVLVPPLALPNVYQSTLLQPEYDAINPNIPFIRPNYPQFVQNFENSQQNYPAYMVPISGIYEPKSEGKPLFLPGNYAQQGPAAFNNYFEWFSKARGNNADEYEPETIYPNLGSLPVENENNFKINPLETDSDELTEENLQYLAPNVREILEGFHGDRKVPAAAKNNPTAFYQSIEDLYDNPNDKKTVGDWLRARKAAVTQTYIQLLLLYDLLSRDAKNQKLNNYHGYTSEIQKDLDEASLGTAAEQLKTVLDRMVARGDCKYDFANNRAKELAVELGKPESRTSMEVRYLKPLRFT